MGARFEHGNEAAEQKRQHEQPPQSAGIGFARGAPRRRPTGAQPRCQGAAVVAGRFRRCYRQADPQHGSPLFGSVCSEHDDVTRFSVAGHYQPPRVAAHLAVLHEAPAYIVLDEDFDVFATVRTGDGEFSQI